MLHGTDFGTFAVRRINEALTLTAASSDNVGLITAHIVDAALSCARSAGPTSADTVNTAPTAVVAAVAATAAIATGATAAIAVITAVTASGSTVRAWPEGGDGVGAVELAHERRREDQHVMMTVGLLDRDQRVLVLARAHRAHLRATARRTVDKILRVDMSGDAIESWRLNLDGDHVCGLVVLAQRELCRDAIALHVELAHALVRADFVGPVVLVEGEAAVAQRREKPHRLELDLGDGHLLWVRWRRARRPKRRECLSGRA
mmetsp:Transcript_52441/g.114386  ORF Transcript_52441/g.114386 Transcript_52441/m.114386 type:complete len:261 (+) Transcript_52441:861-1643(+)